MGVLWGGLHVILFPSLQVQAGIKSCWYKIFQNIVVNVLEAFAVRQQAHPQTCLRNPFVASAGGAKGAEPYLTCPESLLWYWIFRLLFFLRYQQYSHTLEFFSKACFPDSAFLKFSIFSICAGWDFLYIVSSSLSFSLSSWIFTISSKKNPGCTFNAFGQKCPQLNIQTHCIQALLSTCLQDRIPLSYLPLWNKMPFPPASNTAVFPCKLLPAASLKSRFLLIVGLWPFRY